MFPPLLHILNNILTTVYYIRHDLRGRHTFNTLIIYDRTTAYFIQLASVDLMVRRLCFIFMYYINSWAGLGSFRNCIFFLVRPRTSKVRYKYVSHFFNVIYEILFCYFFLHIYGFYCYFANLRFLVLFLAYLFHRNIYYRSYFANLEL